MSRSEYSGISERLKAGGNISNGERLNNPQYKMEKRQDPRI